MSVATSIDLVFSLRGDSAAFVVELVVALGREGWSPGDDPLHLALGDVDEFDWINRPLSQRELLNLLRQKERAAERSGVELLHESGEGVQLLHLGDGVVSISPSVNRRRLSPESRTTDLSWYLDRLLPAASAVTAGTFESYRVEETA